MEYVTGILDALDRDYWLWVAIFAVLYLFSLYIYFFPTPLSGEPFTGSPLQQPTKTTSPK
jgi:hypothetical protein